MLVNNLLFLFVIFAANVIQTITGFAGSMLSMPFSVFLIGLGNAKYIINLVAIVVCSIIAIKDYKYINIKEFIKMTSFMTIGMIVGLLMFSRISSEILLKIYGYFIIVVSLLKLFLNKEVAFPKVVMIVIILIAGIIHGLFISGGSLLVVYAVSTIKEKRELRATLSLIWVVLNTIVLISQIQSGIINKGSCFLAVIAILVAITSIWVGNKIYPKIDQKLFKTMTFILLLISGVTLVL